eukprot:2914294-Pyramimonas_sp.AAC.1
MLRQQVFKGCPPWTESHICKSILIDGVVDALGALGHHACTGVQGSRRPRAASSRLPRNRPHVCGLLDGRGRFSH